MQDFKDKLPEIHLIAQTQNVGALGNLNFLLEQAKTDYFLWLADDDEISDNYLEELFLLLENDKRAVSAMGQWRMMLNEHEFETRTQLKNTSENRVTRLVKFIACESDDSFFYGLHRTENLRRCTFRDYFFPNEQVLTNCCYIFLFDLLWQGSVAYTEDASWICHNYSEKSYISASPNGMKEKLRTLIRRFNVHFLYCRKTGEKAPLLLIAIFPAAIAGFSREIISAAMKLVFRPAKN